MLFGVGAVAEVVLNKSKAKSGGWLAIYIVGGLSGAHLNPAVTLTFAINCDLPWSEVPVYFLVQLIVGILGGVLTYLHYLPHWKETENKNIKLSVFVTGSDIKHNTGNFVSETIGTFFFVLGILSVVNSPFSDGLKPFVIGMLLTVIAISLGGTTGFALNPVRDIGPRIAHITLPIHNKGNSNWSYTWIPIFAPLSGGILAAITYMAIF